MLGSTATFILQIVRLPVEATTYDSVIFQWPTYLLFVLLSIEQTATNISKCVHSCLKYAKQKSL